jgi:hypothetical protein
MEVRSGLSRFTAIRVPEINSYLDRSKSPILKITHRLDCESPPTIDSPMYLGMPAIDSSPAVAPAFPREYAHNLPHGSGNGTN